MRDPAVITPADVVQLQRQRHATLLHGRRFAGCGRPSSGNFGAAAMYSEGWQTPGQSENDGNTGGGRMLCGQVWEARSDQFAICCACTAHYQGEGRQGLAD